MRLDAYTIVFLRRPPDSPQFTEEQLEELQRGHLAFNARMRAEGHALIAGPFTVLARDQRLPDLDRGDAQAGRRGPFDPGPANVGGHIHLADARGHARRSAGGDNRGRLIDNGLMSLSIGLLLVILALIAFILAAIGWTWRKTDLIAVGLALWSLSILIPRLSHLSLGTVILLLAFLAFVAAVVGWGYRKINLIAIGLALWTLTYVIG
jgi:hypothetical protein